jgi:hypothetical protein
MIDFWSVPHFLFGAVAALLSEVLGFPFQKGILLTFGIAVLWEFFEKRMKIGENIRNALSDIVLPLVAFPATWMYAEHVATTHDRRLALLVTVSALYLFTNFVAWRARFEKDRDFMS